MPDDMEMGVERVKRIFKVLMSHYGQARMAAFWGQNDDGEVSRYWAAKLVGVPSEAVAHALMNLPNNPPTITEFLAIGANRPRAPWKALEVKPASKEVAMAKLAECKRILAGVSQ